jgi:hypothetical protein
MWTNLLYISHNYILVHLSCHSITKTKQDVSFSHGQVKDHGDWGSGRSPLSTPRYAPTAFCQDSIVVWLVRLMPAQDPGNLGMVNALDEGAEESHFVWLLQAPSTSESVNRWWSYEEWRLSTSFGWRSHEAPRGAALKMLPNGALI